MRLGNRTGRAGWHGSTGRLTPGCDGCRALCHLAVGRSTRFAGGPEAGFTDWRVAVVAIGRPRFFLSAARGRGPANAAAV